MSDMTTLKEETWKRAAKRFTEGKFSFDELVDMLGYEVATKVAYYKDISDLSFAQGLV